MEIVSQQQDDESPAMWHFKIAGPAAGGEIRLADLSRETDDPETWLAENEAEAQAAIDAGTFNEEFAQGLDLADLESDITNELAWIEATLPEIDTGLAAVNGATLAVLRVIVEGMLQNQKRILQEQRRELKAWRYVIRRLG